MRKLLVSILSLILALGATAAELPDSVYVAMKDGHVQGFAIDKAHEHMYLSFTSSVLKTDLKGNLIGSINRIQGHLGAMTLGPDGRVYASLECKDDEIGKGIADRLGVQNLSHDQSVFYVAIIDVDKIDRVGMDPEKDGVMTTVCVRDACRDYVDSKYGCSGIDGITFAPGFGSKKDKMYLYVAYGIYGDNSRMDNDNQIILCYDTKGWSRYETPVVFGTVPVNGPEKPLRKYFVHTGNTTWGVQNMAYDPFTNRIFLAVYKGKKSGYPNYDLFSIYMNQKPVKAKPKGIDHKEWTLKLAADGLHHEDTDTWGWRFKWGSTGLCPIGDGTWYISENHRDKQTGLQSCTARLYRWTGNADKPFVPAK